MSTPNVPNSPLHHLAIDDATKLVKQGRTLAQAAALAASRAPALYAAPSVLASIVAAGGRAADVVPDHIRSAVCDASPIETSQIMVAALSSWLLANPWELRKTRSVPAALLSASQALKAKCSGEPTLEAEVLNGLKERIARSSSGALANVRRVRGWPISCWIGEEEVRYAALSALPEGVNVTVSWLGLSVVVTLKLPRAMLVGGEDEEGEAMAAAAFDAVNTHVASKEAAAVEERRVEAARAAEARGAARLTRGLRIARRRERNLLSSFQDAEDDEDVVHARRRRRRSTHSRHQPPKCARARRRLAAREQKEGLLVGRHTRATRAASAARSTSRLDRCRMLDRARARHEKRWSGELSTSEW